MRKNITNNRKVQHEMSVGEMLTMTTHDHIIYPTTRYVTVITF